MKNKTCPDCGLLVKDDACKACGWEAKKYIDNTLCAYTGEHGNCKKRGTITDSIRADENTRYYCSYHYFNKGNKKISDQYMRSNKSDTQIPFAYIALNEKMEELRHKMPIIFHIPESEEDRIEYQKIVMGYLRKIKSKTSLPYDKEKSQE